MKRISQSISNIGVIYVVTVAIVIVMHLIDGNKTIEVRSLSNLLIIVSATQIVSEIMEHITIKPEGLHMLIELLAMEVMVFIMGYLFGSLDLGKMFNIAVDALLIALVYVVTVVYYSVSTKYTADEINEYLENKNKQNG